MTKLDRGWRVRLTILQRDILGIKNCESTTGQPATTRRRRTIRTWLHQHKLKLIGKTHSAQRDPPPQRGKPAPALIVFPTASPAPSSSSPAKNAPTTPSWTARPPGSLTVSI